MSNRNRAVLIVLSVVLLLAIPLGRSVMFTVNEREVAVVLQFGKPVASYTEPNLYFKIPFAQEVRRLPKTYQFWNCAGDEILVDLPTADSKKLEVTPWAVWRITDPKRFMRDLLTEEEAETRVRDFVRGPVRDAITSYDLVEAVRSTNRELTYSLQVEPMEFRDAVDAQPSELPTPAIGPSANKQKKITMGREKIVQQIKNIARKGLAEGAKNGSASQDPGRGIELVDVGISRIDFVPIVREEAFKRLSAFMESIASSYTAAGERRKEEILNRTDAEVQEILGEGSRQASIIKSQAEEKIINDYAAAITETGDFYNFIRTLEAYEKSLGKGTRLILTTDSGLLELLQQAPPTATRPPNNPR